MHSHDSVYARLINIVAGIYGEGRLYRRGGVRYPVVAVSAPEAQVTDLDSVLASELPHTILDPADYAFRDSAYLEALLADGRKLYDGEAYVMTRIETNPLRIHGALGTYYDMLMTCSAVNDELRAYAARETTEADLAALKWRALLHQQIAPEDVFTDGRGRCAALGVAACVIFNDGQQYRALLAKRAANTGVGASMYHVLPAFMFEPVAGDHVHEWSVTHQFYREYLEELFGLVDLHGAKAERHDYFYEHPELLKLRAMLTDGRAALYLNGVCMNLLTLRPEISVLLLIHDPAWYAEGIGGAGLHFAWETTKREIVFAPINSDAGLLAALPPDIHTQFVPQGAVTLWMSVDRARRVLGMPLEK